MHLNVQKIGVRALSTKDIRMITKFIRKRIGIRDNEKFPVLKVIEWILSNPKSKVTLEIMEIHEMEGVYALTDTIHDVIKIRSDVYEGAYRNNPRDVFTLCHELGHYFLHGLEAIEFARVDEKLPAFRDPEWQADTFAAEIMAPYSMARNMSVEEIEKNYGMSHQAAVIRHRNCLK